MAKKISQSELRLMMQKMKERIAVMKSCNKKSEYTVYHLLIYCTVARFINFNKKYSTVGQSIIVFKI